MRAKWAIPILSIMFGTRELSAQKKFHLMATPKTIAWGYYDAAAAPVLRIDSGDTVEIETVSGNPSRLESAGVAPYEIQPELRDSRRKRAVPGECVQISQATREGLDSVLQERHCNPSDQSDA